MPDISYVVGSELSESFMGLCAKGSELAKEQGLQLHAVVVSESLSAEQSGMLCASGADKVLHLPLPDADVNSEKAAVDCLALLLSDTRPIFVLFESSSFFCSVAPMLAAKLNCGITADCTELSWSGDKLLRLTRPAFGGKKLAHNENKNNPTMATVRKGVFRHVPESFSPAPAEKLTSPELEQHWLCRSLEQAALSRTDLTGAKIILSGGLGMGSKANYEKLYVLAEKLGASVGASRAAVAAGYAGYEHQVGQTGVSVRPEIYLAFGISGAVQHLAGISGAKYIYAVNSDPKAPIHEYSDYSVIADCNEVVDRLIDLLNEK